MEDRRIRKNSHRLRDIIYHFSQTNALSTPSWLFSRTRSTLSRKTSIRLCPHQSTVGEEVLHLAITREMSYNSRVQSLPTSFTLTRCRAMRCTTSSSSRNGHCLC